MRKKQYFLLLLCGFLFGPEIVQAQENRRKWALRYSASLFDKPFLTHNPAKASIGDGSSAFAVMGEYYLTDKWSLQAGYFHTDMGYANASRLMEGLRLGGRRYFLHPDFLVQPYLSAVGDVNWGQHVENYTFGGASYQREQKINGYTGVQSTVNPRLSFAPGVGVEIYLFSSVAFLAEYNLNISIASHTSIETLYDDGRAFSIRDKGMSHSLSMGIKITFPFTFTSEDGTNLFSFAFGMFNALLDNHNRRMDEENGIYR
jgi:opacity protein-like surface antigen